MVCLESKVPDIKGHRANYGTVSLVLPYKHTLLPSLEPSHCDSSNEGSQCRFSMRNKENSH